jgi:hypothetical protein
MSHIKTYLLLMLITSVSLYDKVIKTEDCIVSAQPCLEDFLPDIGIPDGPAEDGTQGLPKVHEVEEYEVRKPN